MLTLILPNAELYNESDSSFTMISGGKVVLEHSLVSISRWEAKWNIPFLGPVKKTDAQRIDYVRCMVVSAPQVDERIYTMLPKHIIEQIAEYIEAKMTATTFSKENRPPSREIVTSEVIYYWMIMHNIPFECEKWHINRLLTLINVCSIKNQPKKKSGLTPKQQAVNRSALNRARRASIGTTG